MSENPHNNNSNRRNDETLDCIPPGVLVPDFPLVVLYEFVLLLLQSVRLFVREEEEEESKIGRNLRYGARAPVVVT